MKNINSNTTSIALKAIIICVLILVMLIPVAMLQSMIRERMEYQQEAVNEVGSTWGGPQTVTGPVLELPYEIVTGEGDKQTRERGVAHFLPETLRIDGKIDTEVRSRTAHKILLYKSALDFDGDFAFPDVGSLGLKPEQIRWQEASIYIGIHSLQGVQNRMELEWNGRALTDLSPANNEQLAGSGFTVRIPLSAEDAPDTAIPYRFHLDLNGTESLFFVPLGRETSARLQSPWETVSFAGQTLPANRNFDNGFTADWKVLDFNRNFPQAWTNGKYALTNEYDHSRRDYTETSPILQSAFGVDLRFALDHYQLAMRSVKYAIMFIALTFFIFFLIELLSHRRIHPIQYLLVSCGLVLFYSLLLALSEHIGFNWAYLVSAAAIVSLITAYSSSIFKKRGQTLRMGLFLSALYTYLYVMLQLEDLALLAGSVGLFVALAVIMYVSRKIRWYKTDPDRPEPETSDKRTIE